MRIRTAKKAAAAKPAVKTCAKKPCVRKAAKKESAKASTKDVVFTVHAAEGKSVYLAGEFNGWDPKAQKMAYKAAEGIYAATVKLAAGSYQYKFVIDETWCADPENINAVANDQGTFNSVITVL